MPALGKFSAEIAVDNVPLPEYDVKVNLETSTATCWIASEVGKEFVPIWKDSHNEFTIVGFLELDGTGCGGAISVFRGIGAQVTGRRRHIPASATTAKPFVFADVELTEDDKYLKESRARNIGEIKVLIYECELGEPCLPNLNVALSDAKIHERSKKGLGHRIQAGKERDAGPQVFYKSKRGKLLATFIFYYRPLPILQAQGIAPLERNNKRSRDELEEERGDGRRSHTMVQEDQDDKSTVHEGRIAQLEAELRTLRDLNAHKRRRIKAEPSPEPLKLKDAMVDLTQD
ncbi:hypothetical protein BDN72DRAFT_840039 [Pluteus cervinus]|uniref:Uncharacterized protein n=1 Tax=Pluteus cervinus TaxID=181527 RepID=A0ACD3AVB1_9AGAR|nr:hypothetical protein BDN72DRAFT_840039 [Pluteus cervinus]